MIVTGQNQVELQDVEFNESLGPGEFLVDTECTFISAGTELANYSGKEPLVFQPGSWCAYPWRSGAERLQSQPPRRAPARQVLDLPVKDLYTSDAAHERWWQAVCRDYERKGPFDFRPVFDRKPMSSPLGTGTRLGVRSAGGWPALLAVIGLSSRASAAGRGRLRLRV